MEEMLDFPEFDPHGDPIPSKEGKLPRQKNCIPLSDLQEGESGKVIRVNDFDEKFLNYISEIGINLNEIILVQEKRSFDNSLKIVVNNQFWNITGKLAENVFVELKK
jgi:DtxR family Mn-dependent transcriptional regulator